MVIDLLLRLIRVIGMPSLLTIGLLLAALEGVALTLAGRVRPLDSTLTAVIVVIGVLCGFWLARPARQVVGSVVVAVGAAAVIFHVGALWGATGKLLWEASLLLSRGYTIVLLNPRKAFDTLLPLAAVLGSGLLTLLIRLNSWLLALLGEQPVYDPVAAILAWSLLLYAAAVWAAWATRRWARPLYGLAPAVTLLLLVLSYSGGDIYFLLLSLGAALALLIVTGHATREQQWRTKGMDYYTGLGTDLALYAVPLVLLLIVAAAATPSLSWRTITELLSSRVSEAGGGGDSLATSFGIQAKPTPASLFETVRAPGLPRQHLLGSGPELSEQVVMEIAIDTVQGEPVPATLRPYWRSVTYDQYTGRGWRTSRTEAVAYDEGEQVVEVPPYPSQTIQQHVTIQAALGNLLYAAGDLLSVDTPATVAFRSGSDLFGAMVQATTYDASSLVPVSGEENLRSASSHYPTWVQNRYLVLPEQVPQRVLNLARELTATEPTPYDRVRAIERYLRAFPYTLELPAPPLGRDVVDYFLFDLKEGYCDYYATSMVVLTRAAGIPARLAIGYATGDYDGASGSYIVTAADAHSWVEVYFPEYGWVPFEPTGGRPPLERAEGSALLAAEGSEGERQPDWKTLLEPSYWWRSLSAILLLVMVGTIAWSTAIQWRLRRLPPNDAIQEVYHQLYRAGRHLGVHPAPAQTTYEFADVLTERLATMGEGRLKSLIAPASQEVYWLSDLYVESSFSSCSPDISRKAQAIRTWDRVHRRLWLARTLRLYHQLIALLTRMRRHAG